MFDKVVNWVIGIPLGIFLLLMAYLIVAGIFSGDGTANKKTVDPYDYTYVRSGRVETFELMYCRKLVTGDDPTRFMIYGNFRHELTSADNVDYAWEGEFTYNSVRNIMWTTIQTVSYIGTRRVEYEKDGPEFKFQFDEEGKIVRIYNSERSFIRKQGE